MIYKRYMVFEFDCYYPIGGLCDCSKSFDDLDEATEYANMSGYNFIQIFDTLNRCQVYQRGF